MRKWVLKNKDDIIITVISGIIVFFVNKILSFVFNLFSQNQNSIVAFFRKIFQFSVEIPTLKIPLFFIILFFVLLVIVSKLYNFIKLRGRKLKIIEAIYYTDDAHSIDITNELNKAIENDKLKIILSNQIAGDPHYGVVKKGRIKYKINGREEEKEYNEGDIVELP